MAQVTMAICDSTSLFNRLRSAWYCSQASLGRSMITAIVPTVLLLTWQNLIMPNAVRCLPWTALCRGCSAMPARAFVSMGLSEGMRP